MEEPNKNVNELMKSTADQAASWAKTRFNVNLDYSEISIQELDRLLQKASNRYTSLMEQKVPAEMILTQTVNLWGAYLGEYIKRKYGGYWENVYNKPILQIMNGIACPHDYIRQRITSRLNVNVSGYLSEIKNILTQTHPHNQDPSNNQIITSGIFTKLAKNHLATAIKVTAIALAICGGLFLIDEEKVWFSILFFFSLLTVKYFWDEWNAEQQISLEINKFQFVHKNPVQKITCSISWADCDKVEINGYMAIFKYHILGDEPNYWTEQLDEYENPRQIKKMISGYMEIREERKKEEMRIQREQELLREQQKKQQERQYFKSIQDHENLLKSSPIEFEEIVGKCFRMMGYFVEHTPKSHDEGIDLKITKNGKLAVVQCKRYNGSVGQPILRDLYGSMMHNRANEAYLVTTGKMTQAAKTWATGKPITLIAGTDLVEWIQSLVENIF